MREYVCAREYILFARMHLIARIIFISREYVHLREYVSFAWQNRCVSRMICSDFWLPARGMSLRRFLCHFIMVLAWCWYYCYACVTMEEV